LRAAIGRSAPEVEAEAQATGLEPDGAVVEWTEPETIAAIERACIAAPARDVFAHVRSPTLRFAATVDAERRRPRCARG